MKFRSAIFADPLPASNRIYLYDFMSIVPPIGRRKVSMIVRINFISIGDNFPMAVFRRPLPKSLPSFVPTKSCFSLSHLKGQNSVSILLPELMDRLFPATISIFLPSIFMFPFGALIVMPVKALMLTFPKGESTEMARFSVDMEME